MAPLDEKSRKAEGSHGKQPRRPNKREVAESDVERELFMLYAHRQGKSVAAAMRSALKAEIRRHKGRIVEFAVLLRRDDEEILRELMSD